MKNAPRTRETSNSMKERSTFVDYDYLVKSVVVGDSGVGKSQLVARFTRNEFSTNSRQTIGVEFATKTITVSGKNICAQLWDTAGEERYRALAAAYYRGAIGVLLVFDVTNPRSFTNLSHWLHEIRAYALEDCQILLVGNKCDLPSRQIKMDQARAFATCNCMNYIETSALECTNVDSSFTSLISSIYFKTISESSTEKNDVFKTVSASTNGELRLSGQGMNEKIKENCC